MQQIHIKTLSFVAAGMVLAGSAAESHLLAQAPSGANVPAPTSLLSPNSYNGLPTEVNSEQLITPQRNRTQANRKQYQYAPPVPAIDIPAIPSPEKIEPRRRLIRSGLWTQTQFDSVTETRYISERVSGFNDYPQCCLAKDCEFHSNSFGDSVYSAFCQQIANGSAAMMTLYNYDFYPLGTDRQAELSVRGKYQLQKIVSRLRFTASDVKLQATNSPILDAKRRANVIQQLTDYGISENQIVLFHVNPGHPAVESRLREFNLLNSVESRGRTIQPSGSASFSGSTGFGQ